MSRATITDTGADRVMLRTDYNPRWKDEFLRTIPRSSREWTGARWSVHRDCLPRLEALCRRHFDHVERSGRGHSATFSGTTWCRATAADRAAARPSGCAGAAIARCIAAGATRSWPRNTTRPGC